MAKETRKRAADEESGGLFLTFVGLVIVGIGVFLAISLFTADVTLDPGRISFLNFGDAPDPHSSARLCATGLLGAWAAYGLTVTLGTFAAYLVAGLIGVWGVHVIRRREFFATWPQVFGGVIILAAAPLLVDALFETPDLSTGGLFTHVLGPQARLYAGRLGVIVIGGGVAFLGALLAFGDAVFTALFGAAKLAKDAAQKAGELGGAAAAGMAEAVTPKVAALVADGAERIANAARPAETVRPAGRKAKEKEEAKDVATAVAEPESDALVVEEPPPVVVKTKDEPSPLDFKPYETALEDENSGEEEEEVETAPKKHAAAAKPKIIRAPAPARIDTIRVSRPEPGDYQLPPLTILDEPEPGVGEHAGNVEKRAKVLEQTLAEFKIEGKVVQIETGPRVTLFEMTLAPGIRLTKVVSLADNIAMALKAPNVRIIAPIPNKDTIGIEIPNVEKEVVTLREIVASVDRGHAKQAVPIALAKDVSGKPLVADLAKMPHLLIAGATGSGKSVCINGTILSFMMCCKPDDLKMILIDPKVVELSRFKDVPHLMSPVITDMKRAVAVLEWACQKMDERYEHLSMVSVNNISKFNALGETEIKKRLEASYGPEEMEQFPMHLPYIIIIIDELADLMLVSGKEVEIHITRLAAKSRAVGIHIILATQRPSVDVITGLIKANMPCRIAFQVASRVDSRTILDQNGAETLLGAGDMLYLPPGVGKLTRAQGVFVSDEELFRVVDFCKAQMAPQYHAELEGPVIGGGAETLDDVDDLFFESGTAIIESGRGSVSLLQRKLGIGYGRASRIIDQLAAAGVLGPFREGKAREILLTQEEFAARFAASAGKKTASLFEDEDGALAGLRDDEREPDAAPPWDEEEEER